MSKHSALPQTYPGDYTATPEAEKNIRWLEEQVTNWFAGQEVSVFDVVDVALSLTGLTVTAGMADNKACIQAVERW